uniref:Uncharacterized protein n=1 Tax=Oryza brachyantha TaxID=4533 RepID=J3LS90_ORYBR
MSGVTHSRATPLRLRVRRRQSNAERSNRNNSSASAPGDGDADGFLWSQISAVLGADVAAGTLRCGCMRITPKSINLSTIQIEDSVVSVCPSLLLVWRDLSGTVLANKMVPGGAFDAGLYLGNVQKDCVFASGTKVEEIHTGCLMLVYPMGGVAEEAICASTLVGTKETSEHLGPEQMARGVGLVFR